MQTFYQARQGSFLCSISKNLTYPPHLHKQLELVYVLSGSISVTIGDETQELYTGDLAVSFPNTIHCLQTNEKSEIILLIFDSYLLDLPSNYFIEKRPRHPFLLKKQLHKDVSYCMHSLLEVKTPYEAGLEISLIKGFLIILFCRILEPLVLTETHPDDLNLVHQVLVYIDNHFTEPLTLEQVATKLNTSKFYLSRIFNHQLNSSFNFYLNQQRVLLAQFFLVSTSLTITDISFRSGFESLRTFYRAFHSICQMTPTKYRKLNQKL